MLSSRFAKSIGLFIGLALLALSPGCSSIPGLDQYANSTGHNEAEENSALFKGTDQPAFDFGPPVKLSPKNPQAFSIGVLLPADKLHSTVANSLRQGLALAVADVNAAGGINGQPIQLDVVDSSRTALRALRDRGEAVILVGDASLAITQTAELADYPQLIGFLCDFVSVPRMTPKNGLRIYLNGDQEARMMDNYLEAAGINRLTVLYADDLLGQSNQQYMLYLASANHALATVAEGYTASEHDFTLLAKAVYHGENDAIILAGNGAEYPNILAAFTATGWTGAVFGYAGNCGLGPLASPNTLAQTAVYPLPEFAVNPRATEASRAFADEYKTKYGEDPGLPAAYAYDNIRAIAAAAAQASSTDPKKIRESFIGLRNYTGAAGRYEIKADGDTEMPLRLWRANGQPAPDPHPAASTPTPGDLQKLPIQSFSP